MSAEAAHAVGPPLSLALLSQETPAACASDCQGACLTTLSVSLVMTMTF